MSERLQKNIIVGLGAIVTSLALTYGLHLDGYTSGALSAGLYWLHCH